MPTADHSTTCVRGQKTICIPCSQEQYEPIVDNPEQFRRLLDQQIQASPNSLAGDPAGLPQVGHLPVPQNELEAQEDRTQKWGVLYGPPLLLDAVSDRPHRGRARATFFRKFAVPFWVLTTVFGRYSMYWYRLERSLGRFSLVGTTVSAAECLSDNLAADEKHPLVGEKVYLEATAGGGCCLGMARSRRPGMTPEGSLWSLPRGGPAFDPQYRPET